MSKLVLSGHTKRVYEAIRDKGYSPNMWKELGFQSHVQVSQIIRLLVFSGYIREQPKYKAVKGKV